jgi:peptidoglycan hydrolase-like protein with peptidoglycan-binding domain
VHISLTWNGTTGRTSFWAKRTFATDYGPCRARDLNWAGRYTGYNPRVCPKYPAVAAPARSSAAVHNLVRYSGILLYKGSTGPAVSAVQAMLRVPVTGQYLSATQSAVAALQKRHGLTPSGATNGNTWRWLLRTYAH